jgi:transcriptional regulator with XRE-family HTH domain
VSVVPTSEGERGRGVALPRDWGSMRELRQARGMSQARLAELSGVSERTVRSIEGGTVERPQHESLRRIAAVLAYGDTHRARLVDRWTGSTAHLTPDLLGIPDWEVLFRRMGTRQPADGGQMSTVFCDLTLGVGRVPQHLRYLHVHEPMTSSGSSVVWKLTSGLPFDLSAVRFEVLTGGVVDDFFVHGDMAALAIRPDPVTARRGPFLVEYTVDLSGVEPVGDAVEHEWMFGSTSPLQVAAMVVRFTAEVPERVWSVRGASASTIERHAAIPVADGSAQVCFRDLVGAFGMQWEWGDET